MLETIIVALIVGAISSAVSNYIAFKVMQSSTRLEFDAVKSNISRHDAALGRAVYRDHCDSCKDREEVRQKHSDERHQELLLGQDKNIHQVMIAVEKANLSFQLMMQVRNKIVTAYEEMMRVQV